MANPPISLSQLDGQLNDAGRLVHRYHPHSTFPQLARLCRVSDPTIRNRLLRSTPPPLDPRGLSCMAEGLGIPAERLLRAWGYISADVIAVLERDGYLEPLGEREELGRDADQG